MRFPLFFGAVLVGFVVQALDLQPAAEVRVRQGVGNFLAKVKAGEPVKVAYLGGSITEMDGWRRLSREWLQARYPAASIGEIAAAIGGTGSGLGVYRIGQDALIHDPDLLFVEFATNDANVTPTAIWKAFDGIVRQTWQHNPKTDIVFVYTITASMFDDYAAGMCPQAASAMEMLADYYGIASICFGPRVVADVIAGKLVLNHGETATPVPEENHSSDDALADWYETTQGKRLFSKDGVHPILRAHRNYYLESIKAAWPQLENCMTTEDHVSRLESAYYDTTYERAKLVPLDPIMLSGNWRQVAGSEKNGSFAARFGCAPWLATAPGSKIKFRFRGQACYVYGLIGPDCGQCKMTVDGAYRQTTPLFDSYCSYYRLANPLAWSGSDGVHEIEFELDSAQPPRASVSESATNPAKYDGTTWYAGNLMLLGELDMAERFDPSSGRRTLVDLPLWNVTSCGFSKFMEWAAISGYDAYSAWQVDVVATFDRAQEKDGAVLYLKEGLAEGTWKKFPVTTAVGAGQGVSLLPSIGEAWGRLRARTDGLECGIVGLAAYNDGAQVTMELRLYEIDGNGNRTGSYIVPAAFSDRLSSRMDVRGRWFDARVEDYTMWPHDGVLAQGGLWTASAVQKAHLAAKGTLVVESEESELAFQSDCPKTVGANCVKAVTAVSNLEFEEYDLASLPTVDPSWKGGVIVVRENADELKYYGLVGDDGANAWKPLAGPEAPTDGRPVAFQMTLKLSGSGLTVLYRIDSVDCRYAGETAIPVVGTKTVSDVVLGGNGTVHSLAAEVESVHGLVVVYQ